MNVQAEKAKCSVAKCFRSHYARGWCYLHYARWRRHGDPTAGREISVLPSAESARTPCIRCGAKKMRFRKLCENCADIARNKTVAGGRGHHLFRRYGFTEADYERMLVDQDGVCAICKGPQTKSFRHFDVDHDAKTGRVRGLLCRRCNAGLGYIEAGFHIQAFAYLECESD